MSMWSGTDEEAKQIFHDFFTSEYAKMIRCAKGMLKSKEDCKQVDSRAEVVVQETFVLAWTRRREVLASEKPVGWLYEALGYKVLELMREENKWTKRLLRYQQLHVPLSETIVSPEIELIEMVSTEDFNLLSRIYMEGYSYQELSKEMNLSKSALADRVHRIKKKIRANIKR